MTLRDKIIVDLDEARRKYTQEVEAEEITTAKTQIAKDFKIIQFNPEGVTEKKQLQEEAPKPFTDDGPTLVDQPVDDDAEEPTIVITDGPPQVEEPPTKFKPGPTLVDRPVGDDTEEATIVVTDGPPPVAEPPTNINYGPTRIDHKPLPDQASPPESFPGKIGCLIVLRGESAGREIDLKTDELTIGRGVDCDLVLPDITCSRMHARIRRQGSNYLLIDNNSGNGTLLNDKFIDRQVLKEGDRISVGRTILQFVSSKPFPDSHPSPTALPPTCSTSPATESSGGLLSRLLDTRRRQFMVLFTLGGVLGLVILVAIVSSLLNRRQAENRALEARRQQNLKSLKRLEHNLEMARELVKLRDWQQAGVYTQLALKIDPANPIARDYRDSIQREQVCSRALTAARTYLGQKSYESARAAVATVGPESIYYDEAVRLQVEINEKLETNSLQDTLSRLETEEAPPPVKRPRRKASSSKKSAKKRNSDQALALYEKGQIDQAIEQANSSGDKEQLQSLRRFKLLYQQGFNLAQDKSKPDRSLKYLNLAFRLDEELSGAQGQFHEELVKKLYKVHFVTAADAFSRQQYPKSFRHLNQALNYRPDCPQVKKRLKDLERVAKRFYEEAYVIKDSYPDGASNKLRQVIQIIPPRHFYYSKAQRLLRRIQGLEVEPHQPESGF